MRVPRMAAVPLLQFGWKQAETNAQIRISFNSIKFNWNEFVFYLFVVTVLAKWLLANDAFCSTSNYHRSHCSTVDSNSRAMHHHLHRSFVCYYCWIYRFYVTYWLNVHSLPAIQNSRRSLRSPHTSVNRKNDYAICSKQNKLRSFTVLTHKKYCEPSQDDAFPYPCLFFCFASIFFNFVDGNLIVLIVLTAFSVYYVQYSRHRITKINQFFGCVLFKCLSVQCTPLWCWEIVLLYQYSVAVDVVVHSLVATMCNESVCLSVR